MSKRDVSPIIKAMRNFFLGRKHNTALRFEPDLAPRTSDPPNLPDGPHHILSANYYYGRDGRREAKPPELIYNSATTLKIAPSKEDSAKPKPTIVGKTPGPFYSWD